MTNLRAEHELLICIARKSLDERAGDRLGALLQQKIDWDYLLKAAGDHKLLPLLSTHLDTHHRNLTPPQILEQLRTDLFRSRQDNLYLMQQLLRVLQIFKANDIRALAFKGPILAAIVYGDLGLRPAGDLDVLIAKEDFTRAKDLLQSNAHRMTPQLTASQQASHLRFHCEIQFMHQDQFSMVDLHWGLTPKSFPFNLSFESLWSRRESMSIGGQTIETFATEDLFLYLCVHGAKHYWSKLEWVASLAELIRTQRFDWSLVQRRAGETRSKKILCLAILLVRDLFSLEPPAEVCESLAASNDLREGARRLEQRLFQEPVLLPSQTEMFRLNLLLMDRKRQAFKSLLRSMLVPTISDWETLTLPAALYPLYYLLRPLRLLKKYQAP